MTLSVEFREVFSSLYKFFKKTQYDIATVIYEDLDEAAAVVPNADINHQLAGVEELKGTYPFTLERSHKAYRLNEFLRKLVIPEHRQQLLANPKLVMEKYQLTQEEQEMILNQQWIEMIRYGAIFFGLEKLAAVLGKSNPEVYASMRGETMAEFQATRKVSMAYSVAKQ